MVKWGLFRAYQLNKIFLLWGTSWVPESKNWIYRLYIIELVVLVLIIKNIIFLHPFRKAPSDHQKLF
jgi:hypothetical protein